MVESQPHVAGHGVVGRHQVAGVGGAGAGLEIAREASAGLLQLPLQQQHGADVE